MTKTLPILLGCLALATASASLVVGAWAEDGEHRSHHERMYEAEDLEDLLAATEALAADLVTPAKALETASAKATGAPLEVSLGSTEHDGKRIAVWEVEFVSGTSLVEWFVDARTGATFQGETEDVGQAGARFEANAGEAKISMATAVAKVAEHLAGAVIAIEFESEDGAAGWEASVIHDGRLIELFVDGTTGKISVDADGDDDDD